MLSQRVDYLVLVCAARRTARRRYEEAIDDLSDRYATLFGTVLLEGRPARIRRPGRSTSKGSRRAGRRQRRATTDDTTPPGAAAEPLDLVEDSPVPIPPADSKETLADSPARHRSNGRTTEPDTAFQAKAPAAEALPSDEAAQPGAIIETTVETPPVVVPTEVAILEAPAERSPNLVAPVAPSRRAPVGPAGGCAVPLPT